MKTKLVPFDIEKAKNGAKVVTRYGLPAKIVDYPIKNEECPILGLVLIDGKEVPLIFTKTGNHYNNSESCYDLFIEEEEVEEDDSDYNPYKAAVESIADMAERYSPNNVGSLQDFYHEVKVKCREAIEYYDTWNKKQDEKHADNKPKFKVGDWIVQENAGVYKVTEICVSWYEVIDSDELHYSIDFGQESMCHLWIIQDAKPGDILATKNGYNILIFKNIKSSSGSGFSSYYNYNNFSDYSDFKEGSWDRNRFIPATKEQRELLFNKMEEDGYEWDSDKKELHKIGKEVKTRRMTHQELAWWLRDKPEEHREYCNKEGSNVYFNYYYSFIEANKKIEEDTILIRRNGGEWEEPLIEIK